jgi:hypothetical protein
VPVLAEQRPALTAAGRAREVKLPETSRPDRATARVDHLPNRPVPAASWGRPAAPHGFAGPLGRFPRTTLPATGAYVLFTGVHVLVAGVTHQFTGRHGHVARAARHVTGRERHFIRVTSPVTGPHASLTRVTDELARLTDRVPRETRSII